MYEGEAIDEANVSSPETMDKIMTTGTPNRGMMASFACSALVLGRVGWSGKSGAVSSMTGVGRGSLSPSIGRFTLSESQRAHSDEMKPARANTRKTVRYALFCPISGVRR